MAVWLALIVSGVIAPLVVASVVGIVKWGGAVNRALATLGELAADVRDLAAAAQDTVLLRAEFTAHVSLADERWTQLGGIVPHPRYGTADDRPRRPSTAARRRTDPAPA